MLRMLEHIAAQYYIPPTIAKFVQGLLGSGKVLSLYAGVGEFLYQSGGGIGVERNAQAAKWAQFLLDVAEIEATVFNEDPLKWQLRAVVRLAIVGANLTHHD